MNIKEKLEMLNTRCLSCGSKYIVQSTRGFQCKICGATIKIKHFIVDKPKLPEILVESPQELEGVDEVLLLKAEDEVIVFECKDCNFKHITSPSMHSKYLSQCVICNQILIEETNEK